MKDQKSHFESKTTGNRFEWWGEYPRQLGCRGDIAVLRRQSDVFRREYPGPTFWTPPFETVPCAYAQRSRHRIVSANVRRHSMAPASLLGVEIDVRDPAPVDSNRGQDSYDADPLAQPQLACAALCDCARLVDLGHTL